MGERYWVSGAQIGTMLALLQNNEPLKIQKLLDEIQEKQFVGSAADLEKALKPERRRRRRSRAAWARALKKKLTDAVIVAGKGKKDAAFFLKEAVWDAVKELEKQADADSK